MPQARSDSRELAMQTRQASFVPATLKAESRTIELVWTTGADVQRRDWWSGKTYIESLSLDPAHVDLSRLNNGAPVLAVHNQYELTGVIGVVEKAWIDGGEGRAIVRFSEREDVEPLWRDVQAGIIRNVSVGYLVRSYEITANQDGSPERWLAIDWQPTELSMVPVGADQNAGTRSAPPTTPCIFTTRAPAHNQERDMPENIQTQAGANPAPATAEAEQHRAAPQPVPAPAVSAQPTVPAVDPVAAERTRCQGILSRTRSVSLPDSVADDLIARGVALDHVGNHIVDELARRGQQPAGATITIAQDHTDPAAVIGRMAEAVACRYTGEKPSEQAREFTGVSMSGLAVELLGLRGIDTRRHRAPQIIERAMTTSDFPNLLTSTAQRLLLASYLQTPGTFTRIAKKMSAADFRARNLVRGGDFPELLPLNENGELKSGSMTESKESFKLETVGRKLMLTRQALVNDDLGGFADMTAKAGQAAARYENKKGWTVFLSGTMADGKALFHADHANLAGSGAVISATTVGAGKKAIRTQKNADGNTLNYSPSIFAVPAALETTLEQYLSDVLLPAKTADVVPASHRQLQPLVEPLLDANSATAWYLLTDPAALAVMVYAYLEGAEGAQVKQVEATSTQGMAWEVYLDFAAALVEHRGGWKNPGV